MLTKRGVSDCKLRLRLVADFADLIQELVRFKTSVHLPHTSSIYTCAARSENITIAWQNDNFFRGLGPLPPMNPLALCMHACIKKERKLENKKILRIKE